MFDLSGPALSGDWGSGLQASVASSVLPQTHTYAHTSWCLGSLKGDVKGPVSGPVGLADLGMTNVPPTLTASMPHLGALPIPFNEPLVSSQQEADLWQVPCPGPACSVSISLCASLPRFLWAPPPPHSPLFPPRFPRELGGLGDRAAHTSWSHCSTICFCLHLVGRRQERSKRLMRHCAAGLPRRRAAGRRASRGDRELIRSSLTGGKSEISSSPTVNN